MNEPASEVYEIVVENPKGPKNWFRVAGVFLVGLVTGGYGPTNPGGMSVTVIDKRSGEELCSHVESAGDDEGYLLLGMQKDLERMTALDFAAEWSD